MTKLKRRSLLLAVFTFSTSLLTRHGARNTLAMAGDRANPPFKSEVQAKLDDTLSQVMSKNRIPGVVLGIWIPGEGTWITTRGTSNLATKAPMSVDDHFRIGSITKTFTVTALLQLADDKKLKLDDPVSQYLSFVPNGKNITLRMLANMTSGLYSYTFDDSWVQELLKNPQRVWTPRELVEVAFNHPPDLKTYAKAVATGEKLLSKKMQKQRLTWVTLPQHGNEKIRSGNWL